jgi:hypothetical protein
MLAVAGRALDRFNQHELGCFDNEIAFHRGTSFEVACACDFGLDRAEISPIVCFRH